MQFEYGRTAGADDWLLHTTELLGKLPELFQSAMAACSIKLQTVQEKPFPVHVTNCSRSSSGGRTKDIKDYVHAIPALSQVSAEEWHRYMGINKADSMELSAVDWWAARQDMIPALAHIAVI